MIDFISSILPFSLRYAMADESGEPEASICCVTKGLDMKASDS